MHNMPEFIDTHLHLQDFNPDFAPLISKAPHLIKAVLVSASEADYTKIDAFCSVMADRFIPAFGVHPWYADTFFDENLLRDNLEKYPHALIGEIGVDALKHEVTDSQHILFEKQLLLAIEYKRPVIVHAAKAFMALKLHEENLKKVKFTHHGFVNNCELIKFVNQCGGYFGLGALFLKQDKAREFLSLMPRDKILFETDAPFRVKDEEYLKVVEENLMKLADIAEMSVFDLSCQLIKNAKEFMEC